MPEMRRFHASYPGMPDLFHTYCEEHPEWGTCTPESEAHEEIAAHLRKAHTEGKLT